jgi:hypothetical protein
MYFIYLDSDQDTTLDFETLDRAEEVAAVISKWHGGAEIITIAQEDEHGNWDIVCHYINGERELHATLA